MLSHTGNNRDGGKTRVHCLVAHVGICAFVLVFLTMIMNPHGAIAASSADSATDPQVSSTATTQVVEVAPGDGPKSLEGVPPTAGITGTATPSSGSPAPGWQEKTLRDFALMVDWPPVVRVEPSDRVSVRKSLTGTDWQLASIRSFDFRAAAEAGISAEEADARLSGYSVTLEPFYGLRAYMAVLRDSEGQPVERRFRWQVQSWVLGVDTHGPGMANIDLRALSRQLLTVAIQNGLTLFPDPQPSPTLTRGPQVPGADAGCIASFNDVPADMWAASYIRVLACRGVVSGYSDGTFRPESTATRAQLVKMVVLMADLPLVNPDTPSFSDVGNSHAFYRYVETAHAHNLIGGYNDGKFRPDASVSRAQVAKIIVLAQNWNLQAPPSPVTLCDVTAPHWAYTYVQVAIAHGIFTGYGDGCFHPDNDATRAQLSKVLVLTSR